MPAEPTPVHPLVRWVTTIALIVIVALAGWQFLSELGRMRTDPTPSVAPASELWTWLARGQ